MNMINSDALTWTWDTISRNELIWTLPATLGAGLLIWRLWDRVRELRRINRPPGPGMVERRDLRERRTYALGWIVCTALLLVAELFFVIPGAIAMTLPNPPPSPTPSPNSAILIPGLLIAQIFVCLFTIADRFFHHRLVRAVRRRPRRAPRTGPPPGKDMQP